jgi:HK97 family phage prohead protease/HK97 family phage major capsid protein
MNNIEVRNFSIEFRSEPESRHIEGYGSVFNKRSVDLGGFTEIIAEGAFDGVIENSDVKALLDHNPSRGILARSRNGEGSLSLSIDETGLKYSFDAPHTALGDEVIEGLNRGDYSQSSFAFTVAEETWTKEEGGSYLRTITKIGGLYDVSIVADPAYPDTSVAVRSLDAFKETEQREEVQEQVEEVQEETKEEPQVEEKVEETPVEETPVEENKPEEQETEPKENRNNINNTKNIHMSNFSLIKAINDVVNNRNINEDALNVIEMGATEMRKSGLSYSGQIQLPVEERAADTDNAIVATVAEQGKEIVPTDKLNILGPLRGKSILAEAGCTFLTGLVGNISIPTYSGSTCGWKGEMSAADNGMGDFDTVELSPKRLTAYIDISKQFLVQDSVGAEELLRSDIVNALVAKLEQTIFGDAAGDANKPEGIFNGATTAAPSWAGVCAAEADLTDYLGDKRFVMSPTAKSAFKQTTISGEKSDLRLLMDGNEVDGYPVSASSNVVAGGYAFGDFKELVVAQWGAIDIVVDPYTLATKNAIRLVINAFFDAKVRRDGAIKAYKIA